MPKACFIPYKFHYMHVAHMFQNNISAYPITLSSYSLIYHYAPNVATVQTLMELRFLVYCMATASEGNALFIK